MNKSGVSWTPRGRGRAYYLKDDEEQAIEDFNEAIADFSKVIQYNPDDALAYRNRGRCRVSGDEAMADYTRSIELFFSWKQNGITRFLKWKIVITVISLGLTALLVYSIINVSLRKKAFKREYEQYLAEHEAWDAKRAEMLREYDDLAKSFR